MNCNSGSIEKTKGEYIGTLNIDGVDISPIVAYFFTKNHIKWLWIKRRQILEYDIDNNVFTKKNPTPKFEVYMKKQQQGNVAYKGEFVFFKFKYNIFAILNKNNGKEKFDLYVERQPQENQNILNSINKAYNERTN